LYLPEQWPSYFAKAKALRDGPGWADVYRHEHDGDRACVLGYADPEVDAAVKVAIDRVLHRR